MSAPQAGLGGEQPLSDYDRAAFLRNQPVWFAVHSWLRHLTFDQVVELWWMSQAEKATDEERRQRRTLDQNDCYGKSPTWVAEFYAKRREETT